MNVGLVITELLDGRFVPWEKSLEWESYVDLYCLALQRRGHRCVKYVPSIGVSRTKTYRHKFGHAVKRIPSYNRLLAPRALLRPRTYEGGLTTISRQLLGPAFTFNLLREARSDRIDILHYSSYYSLFFIPAFLLNGAIPYVVQYTGGALPMSPASKLLWKLSILPSLRTSRAVLLGDYAAEKKSLGDELRVPREKQAFFNAPIIDSSIFYEFEKQAAQRTLGFDPACVNILAVTFIPRRHSLTLAKDPFLMVDVFGEAVRMGGDRLRLHIAGWGTGETELRRYVSEKGLADVVRFFGMVEHQALPRYYSACDLVFVPYRLSRLNEGSATVEAFVCGRPVVGFKRSPSDATEQLGGILVDDQPKEGAACLLKYASLPDYLIGKGAEGRAVAEQFTLEFAGKRLEEIYLGAPASTRS